jgi:prepilin signal peptidase PulO-like enzyme (type II secretory pathway)
MIPPELGVFLTCLLGLVLGSFTTAVTARELDGWSWVSDKGSAARSACPSCGSTLGFLDLIPLFSWLALRGKCRYCRTSIGWTYPVIELAVVGLCLAVFFTWGLTLHGVIVMAAVPFLVAMTIMDWKQKPLSNRLVAVLGGLGVIFVASGMIDKFGFGVQGVVRLASDFLMFFCVFSVLFGLGWFVTGKKRKFPFVSVSTTTLFWMLLMLGVWGHG